MSSSNPSVDKAPLVAEGGVPPANEHEGDPFQALDDLMSVVEALCPEWPVREPFVTSGKMLL